MSVHNNSVAFIGYGLYAGGAEKNLLYISSYLQKKGIETDIICLKNINEYKIQHKEIIKRIHIKKVLNMQSKIPILAYPLSVLTVFVWLFQTILKKRYDVLISVVEYYPSYLVVFFAKILRKKAVLIIGDNIYSDLKKKGRFIRNLHLFLSRLSFKHADSIICVSVGLADELKSIFNINKEKITTIHNGVDISSIQKYAKYPLPKMVQPFFKNSRIIVTLGRLVDKKNHELAIKALQYTNKHIEYIIIGKGPLEHYLKRLVHKQGLEDRVIFVGFEEKNPYPYIAHSDLFLFPSRYEGFGNVVVESMACGTPVMAVNCEYGPQEIITKEGQKYGLLIGELGEQISPKRLAKNIDRFFNLNKNKLTRLKLNSKRRASCFTEEKMCSAYYNLIKEV